MIRRATPADAEALSDLSRTCFTQTFGHLYAPSDLDAFLDEAYSPSRWNLYLGNTADSHSDTEQETLNPAPASSMAPWEARVYLAAR